MTDATEVAIIGAGPAGLAIGACLARAGVPFIIMEKCHTVAPAWHRHYARLQLHTIRQLSALPYYPMPSAWPRYVTREQLIDYFERYAAKFDLKPRFGETVQAVRKTGDGWLIQSTASAIRAPFVAVASGFNAEPVVPSIAGMGSFAGSVIHSADYRNAEAFAGQAVLVIGMGNTGAEIALDLCERGARPAISLRNGVHMSPRSLLGIPIQVVAIAATAILPARLNDAIFPPILDLALGMPRRHGIRRPQEGMLQQVSGRSKIPVIDTGTMRKIAEGAIRIRPAVARLTARGAVFEGEFEEPFDAIILATGYCPNYERIFKTEAEDGAGPPRQEQDPTLFFAGFNLVVTGLLRQISADARRIAHKIARLRQGRMQRPI